MEEPGSESAPTPEPAPTPQPAPSGGGRGLWIGIIVIIIVIVVIVAAVFAGLFGPIFGPAEPEPVIGTVLPQTGDLERFGPSMANAGTLAVKHINDAGGVLGGQTLRIIHEDSATDAAEGVTAARKLVDVDGAQAIIGAAASAVSQPITEGVTTPGKIVHISPASTSPFFTTFNEGILEVEDRFFFRTAPSDAAQGKVAAKYLYEEKGWRNVSILARQDTYGQGLASTFEVTFLGFTGTSVLARENYDPGLLTYSTELDSIFTGSPDGIYWVPFPTEGEIIMDEWWANTDWRTTEWFGADGIRNAAFWTEVEGKGIDSSLHSGTAPTAALAVADNAAAFDADFETEFGEAPETFSSNVYDAVFLIALAMERGGSAAAQSIRDNLKAVSGGAGTVINYNEWSEALTALAAGSVNYEGASGSVNFDDLGDVLSDYEVWIFNTATNMHETLVRIPEADIPASPPGPAFVSFAEAASALWMPLVAIRD